MRANAITGNLQLLLLYAIVKNDYGLLFRLILMFATFIIKDIRSYTFIVGFRTSFSILVI